MPQFGSSPLRNDSGSGFYSVDDYREILQYAEDRGVEVSHILLRVKKVEKDTKYLNTL